MLGDDTSRETTRSAAGVCGGRPAVDLSSRTGIEGFVEVAVPCFRGVVAHSNHTNPHQHRYLDNPTGGTPQRSKTPEPLL